MQVITRAALAATLLASALAVALLTPSLAAAAVCPDKLPASSGKRAKRPLHCGTRLDTLLPPRPCATDGDCAGLAGACDPALKLCVRLSDHVCSKDSHCGTRKHGCDTTAGRCKVPLGDRLPTMKRCSTDAECPGEGATCDPVARLCDAPVDDDALYSCTDGVLIRERHCVEGCAEAPGVAAEDLCRAAEVRPSLWEHGQVMLPLEEAVPSAGASASVAPYPRVFCPGAGGQLQPCTDAGCLTAVDSPCFAQVGQAAVFVGELFLPGSNGIVRAPLPGGKSAPLSFYNDSTFELSPCGVCEEAQVCHLGGCEADEGLVGAGWATTDAIRLDGAAAGGQAALSWTVEPTYGAGAYAGGLSFSIMGDATPASAAGQTVGRVVVERRGADGAVTTEAVPLVVGKNLRAARQAPGQAVFVTEPTDAQALYAGPCLGGGATCFLDAVSVDLDPAHASAPVRTVRVEATGALRVHAVTLRPATMTLTKGGAPVPALSQGACAWAHARYGGHVFSVPCTSDADCDGVVGACQGGSCELVWGTKNVVTNLGCVMTSATMALNYWDAPLPGFHVPGGDPTPIDKPAPHTPLDVQSTLRMHDGFGASQVARVDSSLLGFLDFATDSCEPDLGGGASWVPRADFALDNELAASFCDTMGPLIDANLDAELAHPGAPLSVGLRVELSPTDCYRGRTPDSAASRLGLRGAHVAPPGDMADVCGTRALGPVSNGLCGGMKEPIPARVVLLGAGKAPKPVALLEVLPDHPLRVGPDRDLDGNGIPDLCTDDRDLLSPASQTLLRPWLDPQRGAPCSSGWLAEVKVVLDPSYDLALGGSVIVYPNVLPNVLADAAGMDTALWKIEGDAVRETRGTTGGKGSSALTDPGAAAARAEELLLSGVPLLTRVKSDGHTVLATGLRSLWVPSPHEKPHRGLRVPAGGGFVGSLVVNDPGSSLSHSLASSNEWFQAPPKPKADPEALTSVSYVANSYVGFRTFTPRGGASLDGGPRSVTVRVHSPALPLLETTAGRAGWDAGQGGALVDEVPGASVDRVAEDGDAPPGEDPGDPDFVDGRAPEGTPGPWEVTLTEVPAGPVVLTLTGTGTGDARVEVDVIDGDGGRHTRELLIDTAEGEVAAFTLLLPELPGAPLEVQPLAVQDGDGDGAVAPADCDDADPAVGPGVAEDCDNGLDDDCDGAIDGADTGCFATPYCPDEDEDGFADCQSPGCDPGGLPCGDCDDAEASVWPGAPEASRYPLVCADLLDNDCDGLADGADDGCGALPFPQVGDPCALDAQCGALTCDNLGGSFTCKAPKASGAACGAGSECASGQCGVGTCCDGPDGPVVCPGLDVDLGGLLGLVSLDTLLPDGCFTGSVALPSCGGVPCTVDVTTCVGPDGAPTTTLATTLDLGPLGVVDLSGVWSEGGACLEGPAPAAGGLALALSGVFVSLCEQGGEAALSARGTVSLAGQGVAFDGGVTVGGAFSLSATLAALKLGPFTLTDVTLGLGQAPTAPLGGTLTLPGSGLELAVDGVWAEAGPLSLGLTLDGVWSPAPGLVLGPLDGALSRDAVGAWSLALDVDETLAVGPLPALHVAGTFGAGPDGLRVAGCLTASADEAQGSFSVGVPLSGVKATVCIDEDGQRRVRALLSGQVGVFGAATAFSGSLALGPLWRLDVEVGSLPLGPVTADEARLVVRETAAGPAVLLSARISGVSGGEPFTLVGVGAYSPDGPMGLALRLDGTLTLLPGVVVADAHGSLDRAVDGTWSGSLALDTSLAVGPFPELRVAGALALGGAPTSLSGCLDAAASIDQGEQAVGPLLLEHVHATLCVDDPVQGTRLGITAEAHLFGAATPSAIAGSLVIGPPWSLSLLASDVPLGPLTLGALSLDATEAPGGVSVVAAAHLTLGAGPSALALVASGAYAPSGPWSLGLSLDGAAWSPVPGLSLTGLGGSLTGSGATWAASLAVDGAAVVGPFAATLSGTLDADLATGAVDGCLTTAASFDATAGPVTLASATLGACVHTGPSPSASGTVTGATVLFGEEVAVTGTVSLPAPWTLTLTADGLALGPFALDEATVTVTQAGTATFAGLLTIGAGPALLPLTVSGDYAQGDGTLALALQEGATWTPAPGLLVDTLGGTLTRAAGAVSASVTISTDVDLGPLGAVAIAGDLTLDGTGASGCVHTAAPVAKTLGGVGLALDDVSLCLAQTPGGATLTAGVSGAATVLGEVAAFTGTLGLDDPWTMTLTLADLALGPFAVDAATLTLVDDGTLSATLAADLSFGAGPAGLQVAATGALSGGDASLALALAPGTTWSPLPGVQVATVGGAVERTAGVWSAHVALDTTTALGPLGLARLVGTFDVTDGGAGLTGCVTAQAPGGGPLTVPSVAGVALQGVSAELCLDGGPGLPTTGTLAVTGQVTLAGELASFTGVLTLTDDGWTLALTVEDLLLGGFSVPLATLTIGQGPTGPPTLTLAGFVVVGEGPGALQLAFSGAYHPAGDLALALGLPPGVVWTPVPGVTVGEAGGSLHFTTGTWAASIAVSTEVTLPLLGSVAVSGTLDAVVTPEGTSLSGCLHGAAPASLLGLPGAAGSLDVAVCEGPGGTTIGLLVPSWTPLPGLTLPAVTGSIAFDEAGAFTVTLVAGPLSVPVAPGLTVQDATVTATFGGAWSVVLAGHTALSAGGLALDLGVEGSITADEVTLTGTLAGTLHPLAALGPALDFFALHDPTVSVVAHLDGGSVEVSLGATFTFPLFGTTLEVAVEGGATLGGTAAFWFTGQATPADVDNDGAPDPLLIPGFPPLTGTLCVGAASAPVPAVDLCGDVADLQPGLTLRALGDLPFELIEDQPQVALTLRLQSLSSLSVEAALDFDWALVHPADGMPGIDLVSLSGLSLFASIDGPSVEVGMGAEVAFKPKGQASFIAGVAEVSFIPSPPTLGVELFLDGRWMEPLTIPNVAVQDPGLAVGVTIAYPPVPTRLGLNGTAFWKKSGAWPPENLDATEDCGDFADNDGDGKTDCADPSCAQDLFCVPNVATVGATFFFDVLPSESGICLGVCLPLPPLIVRFVLKNLGVQDLVGVLEDVRDGAVSVLASVSPDVAAALGTAPLPLPDLAGLDLSLHELSFYLSTHDMEALGQWWTAGLKAKLDASLDGTDVLLSGSLDAKGLLVEGRVSPFDLFGVTLVANPFAREVAVGAAGSLRVDHAASLAFQKGTVEGWVKRATWPASPFGALLASKETATAGWTVGIGAPESVCAPGGACEPKARVTVRLRGPAGERVVRTAVGVVPSGRASHVAVSLVPEGAARRLEILVDGESAPLDETGPAGMAPGTNTAALVLAKGMDRADDLRLWAEPRTAAQIHGQATILPPGAAGDPSLVARWELDYDATGGVAHNSKVVTSGPHLDATLADGATVVASAEGQDLAFRLGLLLDGGDDNGLLLRAGARLPLPLVGSDFAFSTLVRVDGGSALGVFYAPDITLLTIPGAGSLVVGGFGPNGVAGDYDDGLYGAFDVLDLSLVASAKLAFVPVSGPQKVVGGGSFSFACPAGKTCTTAAQHVLEVTGTLDLTADFPAGIGAVGLKGAAAFSSATKLLTVGGDLAALGQQLASGAISVSTKKATLKAKVQLPQVLGLELGALDLDLTLDFVAGTLCGKGSYTQPKSDVFPSAFTCSVDACFGGAGVSAQLGCSGFQPCGSTKDCASGKVCNLFVCSDPLSDGAVCTGDEVCKSGACAGLCYTPLARSDGQTCNVAAPDNCKKGLVCVGVCLALTGHGGLCTNSAQCPAGTTCEASGLVSKCLAGPQADGATCFDGVECTSGACSGVLGFQGQCVCSATSCGAASFCNGTSCQAKIANGGACGSGGQCVSGACGNNACFAPGTALLGGACVANAHCKSGSCDLPLFASSGTCRCDADADCANEGMSTRHCDAGLCKLPVGDFGACKSELWCVTAATCMDKVFGSGTCVTAGGRGLGQSCVNNTHCSSGSCDAVFKTCDCTSNAQCGSAAFCDLFGVCQPKKGDFSTCAAGAECTGGVCSLFKCLTVGARSSGQTCVANAHCAKGLACDGKCYQPHSASVGQTCVNSDHCASGFCGVNKVCGCLNDGHCGSGKFCELVNPTSLFSCKSKLIGGAACGLASNVCASGTCAWGFCACFSQSQCPSSKYCSNTYCNAKKSKGSECSSSVQCTSGSCTLKANGCCFGFCSCKTCN